MFPVVTGSPRFFRSSLAPLIILYILLFPGTTQGRVDPHPNKGIVADSPSCRNPVPHPSCILHAPDILPAFIYGASKNTSTSTTPTPTPTFNPSTSSMATDSNILSTSLSTGPSSPPHNPSIPATSSPLLTPLPGTTPKVAQSTTSSPTSTAPVNSTSSTTTTPPLLSVPTASAPVSPLAIHPFTKTSSTSTVGIRPTTTPAARTSTSPLKAAPSSMVPVPSSSGKHSHVHVGAIIGGVLGGLVFIILVGVCVCVSRQRHRGGPEDWVETASAPASSYTSIDSVEWHARLDNTIHRAEMERRVAQPDRNEDDVVSSFAGSSYQDSPTPTNGYSDVETETQAQRRRAEIMSEVRMALASVRT